jgi:hypothetical protein
LTRPAADAPPDHDWPEIAALIGAIEAESQAAPEAPMRRIVELEQLVADRTEWAEGAVRAVEARDATIVRLVAEIEELRRQAGLHWVYRLARVARYALKRARSR